MSMSMAMSNALQRTVRSLSVRRIACRSFVTENLNKIEDSNKGFSSGHAKDSKISVWWDVQSCKVPIDCDAGKVVSNIRDALRGSHRCGPIGIWGYGDMKLIPSQTLSQLQNSGVTLRHIPFVNDLQYHLMIADMIVWTKDHPPPAIHMVISEAPEETCVLKWASLLLRDRGYDILIVEDSDLNLEFLSPFVKVGWSWRTTFLAGSKE